MKYKKRVKSSQFLKGLLNRQDYQVGDTVTLAEVEGLGGFSLTLEDSLKLENIAMWALKALLEYNEPPVSNFKIMGLLHILKCMIEELQTEGGMEVWEARIKQTKKDIQTVKRGKKITK